VEDLSIQTAFDVSTSSEDGCVMAEACADVGNLSTAQPSGSGCVEGLEVGGTRVHLLGVRISLSIVMCLFFSRSQTPAADSA